MPRPEAIYIPEPVRVAARHEQKTVQEFAESLGQSRNWLYGMFAHEQARVIPYLRLARYAGITLDELVGTINRREMGRLITHLRRGNSLAWLAKESGASQGLLANLAKDTGELKALNSYFLLATACRCKIDDLCTGAETPKMSA